jgi:hypothetical protein
MGCPTFHPFISLKVGGGGSLKAGGTAAVGREYFGPTEHAPIERVSKTIPGIQYFLNTASEIVADVLVAGVGFLLTSVS